MSFSYSPKVFAHRGSNNFAPENSKPAFDLALIEGAHGFETDIQFSKDHLPLLWHDDKMDRIGMPNKSISQYLWEELELLDISLLSNNFHRYCGLMNLDSFLHTYFRRVPLLLELKEMPDLEASLMENNLKILLNRLLAASIKYKDVMISSFDIQILKSINHLTRENFLVANIEDQKISENLEDFIESHSFIKGICLEKSLINSKTMEVAKQFNLTTLAYTCNSEEDLKAALGNKVDIIISDTPGESIKTVNRILKQT